MRSSEQLKNLFVSAVAQHDNIGDLVIRREAFQWAEAQADRVHLLVRDTPAEFVAALGLPRTKLRTYASRAHFILALVSESLRAKVIFMVSPGPLVTPVTVRGYARSLTNLVLLWFVRRSGGVAVGVGRSYRAGGSPLGKSIERLAHNQLRIASVRDSLSTHDLGVRATELPDVAFGMLPQDASEVRRDTVVLSFRYDRGPSIELLDVLIRWLRTNDLKPVLLTQVRADGEFHEQVGRQFGIRHIVWSSGDMNNQLDLVMKEYARARFVITNRLHASIFGAVNGAHPILVPGGGSKVTEALNGCIPYSYYDGGDGVPGALPQREEFESITVALLSATKHTRVKLYNGMMALAAELSDLSA